MTAEEPLKVPPEAVPAPPLLKVMLLRLLPREMPLIVEFTSAAFATLADESRPPLKELVATALPFTSVARRLYAVRLWTILD